SKAGAPVITAASSGLNSGTQTETVNAAAASKLVFTTAGQILTAGVTSGTMTVQRQDQFNNPNTTDAAVTVDLSTISSGGTFRNTADTANITSVSIGTGSSSASFKYNDTLADSPTITATDHAGVLSSAA